MAEDINAIERRVGENPKEYLKVFDNVYDWLKNGKFTINDIDLV
ncbi:MAG: hypothetical protein ACLSWI_10075 [Candidatus Gastranaerophilaceae bacterium]